MVSVAYGVGKPSSGSDVFLVINQKMFACYFCVELKKKSSIAMLKYCCSENFRCIGEPWIGSEKQGSEVIIFSRDCYDKCSFLPTLNSVCSWKLEAEQLN